MVGEWKSLRFDEAVAINPPVPVKRGVVYPFVDMQAVQPGSRDVEASEHREFSGGGARFQHGDTLMARITPCLENGKIARFRSVKSQPIGYGSTEFIVIRGRAGVSDSGFAYYLTQSEMVRSYAISQMTGSSGRQRVPTEALGRLTVNIPPLDEQRAIVHILGKLDDKIELNRRMNDTLEAIARALFKSWFVDFDPVRAKAEGRDLRVPEPLADLFPDSFEDSELGGIPKGWQVAPLSEITTVITKGTTPTQEDIDTTSNADAKIHYVRVNAISEDGAIRFDKLTTIPKVVHLGVLKRSILLENDVLYTIAGTIGRSSIVEKSLLPANTNQAVAIIRPKPTIPPAFLALTMRQERFREELHRNIVHAVQANLSLGMLSKARAVLPPEITLPQLFTPIGAIVKRISSTRAESRTLAALRDTLLPKLISGELRVTRSKEATYVI